METGFISDGSQLIGYVLQGRQLLLVAVETRENDWGFRLRADY